MVSKVENSGDWHIDGKKKINSDFFWHFAMPLKLVGPHRDFQTWDFET